MPFPSTAAMASKSPPAEAANGSFAAASRAGYRAGEEARGHWPADALEAFALRMMDHGLCVSSTMMQNDRCYALNQLVYARRMDDEVLRTLAQKLFRHFEQRQSGVPHDPWVASA